MPQHRIVAVLIGLNVTTLLIAAATLLPAFAANSDVVRARAFELIDDKGMVRALLNVEEGGEAVFRLKDAAGEVRVKMGANKEGSGLLLLDGSTEPAIHLLAKDSGPTVTLKAKDRPPRVITP